MRVFAASAGLACLLALGCEEESSKGQPQTPITQPASAALASPPTAKPEDPGSKRADEALSHKPAKTPPRAKVLSQRELDVMMKRFDERAATLTPERLQAEHEAQGLGSR